MSDTSPASERKILPERTKNNITTEGRKLQLSALLSKIFAVQEMSRQHWYADSLGVENNYKTYAPNSSKKAYNIQKDKMKST